MNTKSKLTAISIGIAAIMMVSLFAVMSVSASVVTDCWIGTSDDKVYFTIYSDAKAEGYARLNVNGAYEERKKFSLNAGDTKTLSFREYRWNGVDDVEVCVDSSCCNGSPIPLMPYPSLRPTPSPDPDLVITDIRENDGTICFKIENWGTEEAGSSYTSLYVNGAYQARREVGSLAACGGSTELCFRYVYTPGTDDIVKVCADSGNDVAESNEGNNCKELIPGGKPDLEIENKCEEWVNETHYSVTFVIHNNGTAVAPAGHNATLYIDGSLRAKGINLRALEPCKTITITLGFRAIECTGDNDTIKVCADADGGIDELDETNNCLENVWRCIPPPPPSPGPDLVITDIWNNDGTICFKIENRGTEEAGSSYAGLYVNGAYQARKKVGSLDSGETTELCFRDYEWTCTGHPDEIRVCADSGDRIDESDETNNDRVETWGGPDLVLEDKTATWEDGTLTVTYTVSNCGECACADAPESVTGIYVDGVLVATDCVPMLPTCNSYTNTVVIEGVDCPCGESLFVGVEADYEDVIEECNEYNNVEVNEVECPPKGEYFAVIVGVSEYAEFNDLNYCDDDANDIYSRLLSYDNWEASNMRLLIDSDATKSNIHDAIDWMKTNADDNDICLFFFSGHGSWSDDVPPLDEYDGYDEYICPYDSTYWFDDNIRDDELDEWMTPITAKKIVILDSCLAGGAYRGTDTSVSTT